MATYVVYGKFTPICFYVPDRFVGNLSEMKRVLNRQLQVHNDGLEFRIESEELVIRNKTF